MLSLVGKKLLSKKGQTMLITSKLFYIMWQLFFISKKVIKAPHKPYWTWNEFHQQPWCWSQLRTTNLKETDIYFWVLLGVTEIIFCKTSFRKTLLKSMRSEKWKILSIKKHIP